MSQGMTDDLEALDQYLRARMSPWLQRAYSIVADKLDDAQAHAEKALTKRAKDEQDGRPTLRILDASPSLQAAHNRIREMGDLLVGPTVASRGGVLRDAREAFYRDSFVMWQHMVPRETWVAREPAPTEIGVRKARTGTVHGWDLRDIMDTVVSAAIGALRASVNAASSRSTGQPRLDLIATWRRARGEMINRAIKVDISDSDQACHTLALLDLVHPRYLTPNDLALSSHDVKR